MYYFSVDCNNDSYNYVEYILNIMLFSVYEVLSTINAYNNYTHR